MADCETLRFEMYQNDTRTLNFKIEDEAGEPVESIEDSTEAIFALFDAQGLEVIRLDLDDGITLFGHIVTVKIPKDNGFDEGEYEFELQVTTATGDEETLAQGGARVKRRLIA